MGLFKKGFDIAREEQKRIEKRQAEYGKKLFRLIVTKDNPEVTIRFLTSEPINFYEHTIEDKSKKRWVNHLCTQEVGDCKWCNSGSRASFKGAFLVWDYSEFERKDKDTGKKVLVEGSLKLYIAGATVLAQLDRLNSKYGLTDRDYTIVRTGTGTSTSYTFDRGEKEVLTLDDIEVMIPENLSDLWTGKKECLYDILEKQLDMMVEDFVPNDGDNDDEEDLEDSTKLVDIDDGDEEDKKETPKEDNKKSKLGSRFKKK